MVNRFCVFSLWLSLRKEFERISNNDSEIRSIEITNKTKNIVFSSVYRPPNSSLKEFKSSLKPNFDDIHKNSKDVYLVRDFNVNILDYEDNMKVQNFVKFAFQNSLIPHINKPAKFS